MTIVVGADTSPVRTEIRRTEREVSSANLAMITAIRQTAQAGILVLQIAGVAMGQIMSLLIETVLVTIEVVVKARAATSLATFGLTGFVMIGQIVAMMLLIQQVRTKQSEMAQKTNAAVQLLRMGTY